jgi:WD40 repeat protein
MLTYFNRRFLISLSLILAYLGGVLAQSGVSQDTPIQKGHTHDILFVGWAPNGDLIASYSWGDGTIKLWEPHSGRLLWDLKVGDLSPGAELRIPMERYWRRGNAMSDSDYARLRVAICSGISKRINPTVGR